MYVWQVRAAGPDRGLPAGAAATGRAPDAAQAPPKSLSGTGAGGPTGVPTSISQGAYAAESRVGPDLVAG